MVLSEPELVHDFEDSTNGGIMPCFHHDISPACNLLMHNRTREGICSGPEIKSHPPGKEVFHVMGIKSLRKPCTRFQEEYPTQNLQCSVTTIGRQRRYGDPTQSILLGTVGV